MTDFILLFECWERGVRGSVELYNQYIVLESVVETESVFEVLRSEEGVGKGRNWSRPHKL